jgi:CDP-diacylglycerol--glycerol-3-phosphate 3-phosphatidyltransferase
MAIDSLLRACVARCGFVHRIAEFLASSGISPNLLSLLSLACAVLAGLSFSLSGTASAVNHFLVLALVCVCLNALLDGFDGLVARAVGTASQRGDFLDHVVDRYSDVFIIGGIIFGGYAGWRIGIVAVIGVLLASYMGTQAQAVGLNRLYGGVLGRADRIMIIISATALTLLYPFPIPSGGPLSYSFLGWLIVILAVLGHATALQRIVYVWRRL